MLRCEVCGKEVGCRITDVGNPKSAGVECGCSKKMVVKSAGIKFKLVRTSAFEDSGRKWKEIPKIGMNLENKLKQ